MAKANTQNNDFYKQQKAARDRAYYEQLNNPAFSEQATPMFTPTTPNVEQSQIGPGSATFGQSGNNMDGTNVSTDIANILGNTTKALEVASEAAVLYSENADEDLYATLQIRINEIEDEDILESEKIKKKAQAYTESKDTFYLKANVKNMSQVAFEEGQKVKPALYGEWETGVKDAIATLNARTFKSPGDKASALLRLQRTFDEEFKGNFDGMPKLKAAYDTLRIPVSGQITTADKENVDEEVTQAITEATLAITDTSTNATLGLDEQIELNEVALGKLRKLLSRDDLDRGARHDITNAMQSLYTHSRNVAVKTSSALLTQSLSTIRDASEERALNTELSHDAVSEMAVKDLAQLAELKKTAQTPEDRYQITRMETRIRMQEEVSINGITDEASKNLLRAVEITLRKDENLRRNTGAPHTSESIQQLEDDLKDLFTDDKIDKDNLTETQMEQLSLIRGKVEESLSIAREGLVITGVVERVDDITEEIAVMKDAIVSNGLPVTSDEVGLLKDRVAELRSEISSDETILVPEKKRLLENQLIAVTSEIARLESSRSTHELGIISTRIQKEMNTVVNSLTLDPMEKLREATEVIERLGGEVERSDLSDNDKNLLRAKLAGPSGDGALLVQRDRAAMGMLEAAGITLEGDDGNSLLAEFEEYILQNPDLLESVKDDKGEAYDIFLDWVAETGRDAGGALTPFSDMPDDDPVVEAMMHYVMPKLKVMTVRATSRASREAIAENTRLTYQSLVSELANYTANFNDLDQAVGGTHKESLNLVARMVDYANSGGPNESRRATDIARAVGKWASIQVALDNNPDMLPAEEIWKTSVDWMLGELGLDDKTTGLIREKIGGLSAVTIGGSSSTKVQDIHDSIVVQNEKDGTLLNLNSLARSLTMFREGSQFQRDNMGPVIREDIGLAVGILLNRGLQEQKFNIDDQFSNLPEATRTTILTKVDTFLSKLLDDNFLHKKEDLASHMLTLQTELTDLLESNDPKQNTSVEGLLPGQSILGVVSYVMEGLGETLSSDRIDTLLGMLNFVNSGTIARRSDGVEYRTPTTPFAEYDHKTAMGNLVRTFEDDDSFGNRHNGLLSINPEPTVGELQRAAVTNGNAWKEQLGELVGMTKDQTAVYGNSSLSSMGRADQATGDIARIVNQGDLSSSLDILRNPETIASRTEDVVGHLFPYMAKGPKSQIAFRMSGMMDTIKRLQSEDITEEDRVKLGLELQTNQDNIRDIVLGYIVTSDIGKGHYIPTGGKDRDALSTKFKYLDDVLSGVDTTRRGTGFWEALHNVFLVPDDAASLAIMLADREGTISLGDLQEAADTLGYDIMDQKHRNYEGSGYKYVFYLQAKDDVMNNTDRTNAPIFIDGRGITPRLGANWRQDDGRTVQAMLSSIDDARGERDSPARIIRAITEAAAEGETGLSDLAALARAYVADRRILTAPRQRVRSKAAEFGVRLREDDPSYIRAKDTVSGEAPTIDNMFIKEIQTQAGGKGRYGGNRPAEYEGFTVFTPDSAEAMVAGLAALGIERSDADVAATLLVNLFKNPDGSLSDSVTTRAMINLHARLMDGSNDFTYERDDWETGSGKNTMWGINAPIPNVTAYVRDGQVVYGPQDVTETPGEPDASWYWSPGTRYSFLKN